MEFVELRDLWNNESETDILISVGEKGRDELTVNKLRNSLTEIKWSAIIEIVLTVFWIMFLQSFISDHMNETVYLVFAISLLAVALYGIIIEVYKLFLYSTIDYGFSVAKAQAKMEKLRMLERIDLNLLYLFIPLLSVPLVVVLSKAFLGIDLMAHGFAERQMALFIVVSFIIALVLVFILKRTELKEINQSIDFLKDINSK